MAVVAAVAAEVVAQRQAVVAVVASKLLHLRYRRMPTMKEQK